MLCLALLCFGEDGTAAANLRAPIIINVKNRLGVQTIQSRGPLSLSFSAQRGRKEIRCADDPARSMNHILG